MVRNTHLMLSAHDASGAVSTAGFTMDGFPDTVRLQVEVLMEDGSRESNWVTIPLKITDALGIPPVKRMFLPPSAEEMLEAQTKLGDLERRLEEGD